MKDLRRRFERFCLKNKYKGIPNLMLFIAIGNVAVYLLSVIDPSNVVYSWLHFSRSAILHGQVWRLFTYIFTYMADAGPKYVFLSLISLFCYYQFGKILEQYWGQFKFNLYYLSGVLMTDLAAILLGIGSVSTSYLNLSLFLAIATIAPEAQVLLFFFIPLKMKYMAWVYLGFTAFQVVTLLLGGGGLLCLFPIVSLLNYFLYFGSDIRNVFTFGSGYRRPRPQKPAKAAHPNTGWANSYQGKSGEKPYRHKCAVCGKTDAEYPNMEFRYCSKCNGYYCYCMDHINNHVHIQ